MKKKLSLLPVVGILALNPFQLSAFADTGNVPSTVPSGMAGSPYLPASNPGSLPTTPNMPVVSMPGLTTALGALGEFLTDSSGRSLYVSDLDAPKLSNCNGPCTQVWIPFVVAGGQNANPSGHVTSSLVGNILRSDGLTQVTYKDMPLYHYAQDKSPGDMKGQGMKEMGASWFLVKPDGTKLMPVTNAPTTGTPTGSAPSSGVPPSNSLSS